MAGEQMLTIQRITLIVLGLFGFIHYSNTYAADQFPTDNARNCLSHCKKQVFSQALQEIKSDSSLFFLDMRSDLASKLDRCLTPAKPELSFNSTEQQEIVQEVFNEIWSQLRISIPLLSSS